MTSSTICYARAERHDPHTIRCAVCRLAWDIDDQIIPECPKLTTAPAEPITKQEIRQQVEGRWEFASGLPFEPTGFVDKLHNR